MKKPNQTTTKQNAVINNGEQTVRTTRRSTQKQSKVLQKPVHKIKGSKISKKPKSKRSGKIFEIERILKVRTKNGDKKQYLVAWKGYSTNANRWVDANLISNLSYLLSKKQGVKSVGVAQAKQKKIKKQENAFPITKPVNTLRSSLQAKKRQQLRKAGKNPIKKTGTPQLINLDSDQQPGMQQKENKAIENIKSKQDQIEIQIKDSEQVEQISPPAIEPKSKNEAKENTQRGPALKQKQKGRPQSIDIEASQEQPNKINQATNQNKPKPNNSRYSEEQLKILQQFYDE